MKILELEIKCMRGIKDLILYPKGNTIVIWGPNGTGKSGVIDAVDFLLTGEVTRLLGKGTQGLTLKIHGPHIDSSANDAYVRAMVQIEGIKTPVELIRRISNPTKLDIVGCTQNELTPIISIAQRGQHVLTRREILEYITSEPSTRSQQIQHLLNVYEVEKIRLNFVKISNKASKSVSATQKALEQAKFGLLSTLQERNYDKSIILNHINSYRNILHGEPIEEIKSNALKKDILAPKLIISSVGNISLIEKNLQSIRQIIEKHELFKNADLKLRTSIAIIQANPELVNAFKRKKIIELGIEEVNKYNLKDCPLCDAEWEEHKLNEHLQDKIKIIGTLSESYNVMKEQAAFFNKEVSLLLSNLERVVATIKMVAELKEDKELLIHWEEELKRFYNSLESEFILNQYLTFESSKLKIENLFAPIGIEVRLETILTVLGEKFPKSSPEQDAWDTLTRLEENLKAIEISGIEHDRTKLFAQRAIILNFEFEKSRDKILNELYLKIQDRFVELYRDLHGEDEKGFTAKIEPKGAGLNFEVDFHGRGSHPPHALHSEGHQDSMGLCLFLALAEYLAEGIIDVILLDDVVMSVDAEHRKSLCRVLASNFPKKQFIITTHDKTWANQLKSEGIVNSKTSIEFYNWDIATGPHVNLEKDIWTDIASALKENDIPKAAAKLRRGSESFFEGLCDSLEAPIIYRQNRRWELGNFMPAAVGEFRSLLKTAKNVAQSWGNTEAFNYFNELDSTASQIYQRTQAEQWGVNSSVHYDGWTNLNANDFQPIADSFEDLFNLFLCSNLDCRGMIRVVKNGMIKEAVKCNCGKVNWNLVAKKK